MNESNGNDDSSCLNQGFIGSDTIDSDNTLGGDDQYHVRPHTKKDDSSEFVDGSMQATAPQLCSLPSIRYAKDIVGFHLDNPAHLLTQVMILVHLK